MLIRCNEDNNIDYNDNGDTDDNDHGNDDNDDGNGDATFLFISTPFGLSDCPKILQSRCRCTSLGGDNDD